MTENHPHNNNNFYGATKIAGEQMCHSLFHRYRGTSQHFDFVGLRYMNVYGARQDYQGAYIAVVMKILDRIDRGLPPMVYGDGSQAYDFIYVEDVERCNIDALISDTSFGFYNVGTGVKTSIRELCDTILRLKNSDLKVTYKPYSADDARALVKNRIGSPVKAKKDLGFEYKYDLKTGLQRLIDWRDNGGYK